MSDMTISNDAGASEEGLVRIEHDRCSCGEPIPGGGDLCWECVEMASEWDYYGGDE